MERVVVTGASGFVGTYLVRRLKEMNYETLLLSRKGGEGSLKTDLNDPETYRTAVCNFQPDIAYHLAWEDLPDYSFEMCQRNLTQGLNFYNILLGAKCSKIITTGTCWEYGDLTGKLSVANRTDNVNLFAATKQALRRMGKAMAAEKGCQFIWARPFFIYGRGQRKNSLIPSIIEAMQEGRDPEIRNPKSVNDYIYVKDVANCLVTLARSAFFPEIINIGTGRPFCTDEVRRIVGKILDEGSEAFIKAEPSPTVKANGFWADIDEITQATGWRPNFDIVDGVRATIQQSRKNI